MEMIHSIKKKSGTEISHSLEFDFCPTLSYVDYKAVMAVIKPKTIPGALAAASGISRSFLKSP